MRKAALVELRVEEERAPVVDHLEPLAGPEPVQLLEHAHHRLRRLESPDVDAHDDARRRDGRR